MMLCATTLSDRFVMCTETESPSPADSCSRMSSPSSWEMQTAGARTKAPSRLAVPVRSTPPWTSLTNTTAAAPACNANEVFSLRCKFELPDGASLSPRFTSTAFPFKAGPRRSRSSGRPFPASISDAVTAASVGVFARATALRARRPEEAISSTVRSPRDQAEASKPNRTTGMPDARRRLSARSSARSPLELPVRRWPMWAVLQASHSYPCGSACAALSTRCRMVSVSTVRCANKEGAQSVVTSRTTVLCR